ncbi:MAG: orotate phosphoribosyltransferase [Candidatus Aenigmatarchaeota archaeon]|nr:MAG: orotate phosphoribosyltransferase [Candidatus Aenigmarchaeota archaeon]
MKVAGICAECSRVAKPAYTCSVCGASVCSKCFNTDLGTCRRCAGQSRRGF